MNISATFDINEERRAVIERARIEVGAVDLSRGSMTVDGLPILITYGSALVGGICVGLFASRWDLAVIVAAAIVVGGLVYSYALKFHLRSVRANLGTGAPPADLTVHVRITSAHIVYELPRSELTAAWSKIDNWWDDGSHLILFAGDEASFLIPRSELTPEEWEALMERTAVPQFDAEGNG